MAPDATSAGAGPLYDAHLHLQDPALAAAGSSFPVTGLRARLVNGTRPADWANVRDLPEPTGWRLLRAYGVHPWYVNDLPTGWETELRAFLGTGAASLGEIGLDNWIAGHDEARQEMVFLHQLRLARELGLPPTLHCLRAWDRLLACLRQTGPWPTGFLVHAFSGSIEVLYQLLDLGAHFSFSAYAADPRRRRMREAIRACPPDRLLLETDAPDMLPPEPACRFPLHAPDGRRLHDPREIVTAAHCVAALRGEPLLPLLARMESTFLRLFGPA